MKTFVVRLFVTAEPEFLPGALHGVVEEIAGGRSATFGGTEELVAFLLQHRAEAGPFEESIPRSGRTR